MIPETALPPLRQAIRVLQIVVAALAVGVIVFAGVAISHNLGKPAVFGGQFQPLNLMLLGFGVIALAMGVVLPLLVFRGVSPQGAIAARLAAHPPEVQRVLLVQARLQMATIMGCAIFEGGAFANLVAYMQTGELLNLLLAGVLLAGILLRFPFPGRTMERIEQELQRQKEEEGLRQPGGLPR